MIYLDQLSPPNEIARMLWRELGSETCRLLWGINDARRINDAIRRGRA
jgi:hypothetical protein